MSERRSKSPPPTEKKSSRLSGVSPRPSAAAAVPLPSSSGTVSPASEEDKPKVRKKRVSGVAKKGSSSKSAAAAAAAALPAGTVSPAKTVAGMALDKGSETRHKKIDSMSSSLVELLQMQVDRLEVELKRKTAEAERAEKRAEEAAATAAAAAAAANSGSGAGEGSGGGRQLGADGPLRVELATLRASVKSMAESEERHKTRIQQLLRSLAEEREGKEDAIRQAEMKQATIDVCATEMDRLEAEKKELIEQLEVKQTSVELLSTQEESLQTLCEATEARLAELQAASEAQRAASRAALERSHAETGKAVAESRDLARALEAEKAARAAENEQAARELAQLREESEESDAKYKRELEKLEAGVAAIASGRGRLEQLKELHEQMDKKEAEWKETREHLEATIEELQGEIETLAESNAQLTSAMEELGQGASGVLESRDMQGNLGKLEGALAKALEQVEGGEKTRKELQQKLDATLERAAQAEERVAELTEALHSATRDLALAAEAAASQKKIHEAQRAQAKAAEETAVSKRNELENKLSETTKERDELRTSKAELERSLSVGERELAARLQQHAGEIEELKGEKASLKERLNDAIQERWATEEELRKAIEGQAGGGGGGPAAGGAAGGAAASGGGGIKGALQAAEEKVVELEMKIRDLSRKLQDAEGEAKRSRMEVQEAKTKHGDAVLKLKEQQAENEKLVTGLKMLSAQVIELEENGGADEEMEADLAAAEELAEQLEEQVKTLKEQLASAGGPPDTTERDALQAKLTEVQKELADKLMAFSALEEDVSSKEEQVAELLLLLDMKSQEFQSLASAAASAPAVDDTLVKQLQEQIKADAVTKLELEGQVEALQKQAALLSDLKRRDEESSAQLAKATEEMAALQHQLEEARTAAAQAAVQASAAVGPPAADDGRLKELEEQLARAHERQAALQAELEEVRSGHESHLASRAQIEEELRSAAASTDQRIAELERQLTLGGQQTSEAATGVNADSGRVAELESRLAELEARTAYVDQIEAELQAKKMQVLAMTENHEEVQKEIVELREKAGQLDETVNKAAQMEEFLMGLQDERNTLAEKLETAEQQVATLGALLGRAQSSGNAEEIQRALEAAKADHAREIEALKVQVAKRDEELERVQGAMSTLRHAHEARKAVPVKAEEPDTAAAAAAAAAAAGGGGGGGGVAADAPVAAAAVAAAAPAEAGGEAAAGEGQRGGGWEVVSENLGPVLVALNTAKMDAAKERQSFADKKAFKDPEAFVKAAQGKLLGVAAAGGGGAVVGVCAVVKSAGAAAPLSFEMKYVAMAPDVDALGALVAAAEVYAAGQKADQLLALHNGAMSDAEKKWGSHGFKLNGVGPAPEFQVRLCKALK